LQRRRAVLGGGLGALFLGLGGWWAARPEHWADLRSGTGEVRSATLADGSTVELGSRTALSLDYSDRTRRLVLHEGEAFFIVAADPRPFVVAAEAGEARALGTRFNMRALDGVVTVAVAEHSVAVTVPAAAPATVDEGWQLAYGKSGIEALEPADLASIAAWRQGRLIFRNTPLRAVLSEIGRYRDGTIVLLDDRLGSIPVTAVFDIASIGSALDTIEATLPIRLTRATDFLVFVTAG
jgi:transmembrane sensor